MVPLQAFYHDGGFQQILDIVESLVGLPLENASNRVVHRIQRGILRWLHDRSLYMLFYGISTFLGYLMSNFILEYMICMRIIGLVLIQFSACFLFSTITDSYLLHNLRDFFIFIEDHFFNQERGQFG